MKISVAAAFTAGKASRLLLVKPTYKPGWDLPGGILEEGESPTAGLKREIREELGVECVLDDLACVDFIESDWEDRPVLLLMFLARFRGSDKPRFRLQPDELCDSQFYKFGQARHLVSTRMRDRLDILQRRLGNPKTPQLYLQRSHHDSRNASSTTVAI